MILFVLIGLFMQPTDATAIRSCFDAVAISASSEATRVQCGALGRRLGCAPLRSAVNSCVDKTLPFQAAQVELMASMIERLWGPDGQRMARLVRTGALSDASGLSVSRLRHIGFIEKLPPEDVVAMAQLLAITTAATLAPPRWR